ncbi:MAG: hypothetical protein JNL43_07305 [Flavobacteriales bacterium]|nr:hypothetical protein [Flavobacteriales bacterium]
MRLLPGFLALVILTFGCSMPTAAQEEGLARDFEKLSAKERARIAKEEQEAAAADGAFQAVMSHAEDLFRQLRYEESMAKFKEARTMRPYNVYPKVKIQDLQALIAKRDAEAAVTPVPEPVVQNEAPVAIPAPVAPPPVEPMASEEPERIASDRLVISGPVREPSVQVVRSPPPPVVVQTVKAAPIERAPPPVQAKPSAVRTVPDPPVVVEGQRVYKEGRSVVVENTVAQEGHLVTFRKVSHPWGEVNHFRDGVPISGRAYQQAMEDR